MLLGVAADDRPGAVDVALDEVTAEPAGEFDRALKVDSRAGATSLRLVSLRVSPMTSAMKPRGAGRPLSGGWPRNAVTVRHTPLTAMESPTDASWVTVVPRI